MTRRPHPGEPVAVDPWPAFERRLEDALSRLEAGTYLVLTVAAGDAPDRGLYVQFATAADGGLRAEAASNR